MEKIATTANDQARSNPLVIVGAGPIGLAVAKELHRRCPELPIVIYGVQHWFTNNQIHLASILSGNAELVNPIGNLQIPNSPQIKSRLGHKIIYIDRERQSVIDDQHRVQPYSYLILATGSTPFIPGIRGVGLSGVYHFRDIDAAMQPDTSNEGNGNAVVIGGGIVGIEAARALQKSFRHVSIIERYDRLMSSQLDVECSAAIKRKVEAAGIQVILNDVPNRIFGRLHVEAVQLRSGKTISCGRVIVAAGIRPNHSLAFDARLNIGRGIRVDDTMRTSDPRIFAVGECAEYREQVCDLPVNLEQAGIVARVIAGEHVQCTRVLAATRLKVLGCPIFSMGEVGVEELPSQVREFRYSEKNNAIYRKILVRHGKAIGALALGPWEDLHRIQDAVAGQRYIWPWQLWFFRRHGVL